MPELDLTPEGFVANAVRASAGRGPVPASGVVTLAVGRARIGLDIRHGRVVGPAASAGSGGSPGSPGAGDGATGDEATGDGPGGGEPAVTVPLTAAQLQAMADGSQSMAQAFMRGDIKPEGSTRALLALIELFEDPSFRQGLVG